jgi:preprotein translocase subunit SecE
MSIVQTARGFVDEVSVEMRKVSWPTRSELRESTIVVIASVFIVSILIGIIDLIFTQAVKLVIK